MQIISSACWSDRAVWKHAARGGPSSSCASNWRPPSA